jgi:hypothetical protein
LTGKPTGVSTSQASVNLSGFNNDLSLTVGDVEWTDVLNKPTFFSGSYNDLTDRPDDGGSTTWVDPQGRPAWINYFGLGGTTDTVTIGTNSFKSGNFAPNGQAVFDLGSSDARWRRVHTSGLRVYGEEIFADRGMNAGGRRVTNVAAPTTNADVATKKYVDDSVADVEVGPPGTTSFNEITDKPTWVGKFSYDDIGQYMDPAQPSNFDIVVSDSLTPSANSTCNLGQDLMRFLFGFFQRVRLSGNTPHYDDEAIPYHFLRSYVAETPGGLTCLDAVVGRTILAWLRLPWCRSAAIV